MKTVLKRWVRILVLATSTSPLGKLYLVLYQLTISIVKRRLRTVPGLRALYLRRGAAKGEITPGVSDLDFAVVANPESMHIITKRYLRLSRWIPFLESEIACYTTETFHSSAYKRHQRYRFREAKETWSLLAGECVLDSLMNWELMELSPGLHREIRIWFRLYVDYLVLHPNLSSDPVFRASFCYKFLIELLKQNLAWLDSNLVFRRSTTLELSRNHSWHPHLAALSKQRFLDWNGRSLDLAWRASATWLEDFFSQTKAHAYHQLEAHFGDRTIECHLSEREMEEILLMEEFWGAELLELRATPCLYLEWGEHVAMLCFRSLPSFSKIQEFARHFTNLSLRPYFCVGQGALTLSSDSIADMAILDVFRNPEVFLHIEASQCGPSESFREVFQSHASDLSGYRDSSESDFEKKFWSSSRLAVTLAEVSENRLIVLDSRLSLEEALKRMSFPVPSLNSRNEVSTYLRELWSHVRSLELRH